ncbi:MAG TPA: cation:proton antiporter [Chthoniobacterales bacterium]
MPVHVRRRDIGHLRHRAHTAVLVRHVSICFSVFSRSGGVALALSIACGYWVLAFIVVIVRSGAWASVALSLGLVCAFVAFMVFVVRPQLPRGFSAETLESGVPSKGAFAAVLTFFAVSALSTEILGIHALFGAFLAGVVMPPQGPFRQALKLRLENFSSVFLLPLFFAFTGLRTQFGLLDDVSGWGVCLGIVLIATLGKLGGSMFTVRWTGMPWLESFRLRRSHEYLRPDGTHRAKYWL